MNDVPNADLLNKQARRAEPYFWNAEIENATGKAFNWLCPFCGADLKQTGYHKAHIFPVGSDIGVVPGNIVLACPTCNMSMHDKPAWEWCVQCGISYGHIQFTLEVIRRIFTPELDDDGVANMIYKPTPSFRKANKPDALKIVIAHLDANPDDANLPARQLGKLLKVGHDTANKGRNLWRSQRSEQ